MGPKEPILMIYVNVPRYRGVSSIYICLLLHGMIVIHHSYIDFAVILNGCN